MGLIGNANNMYTICIQYVYNMYIYCGKYIKLLEIINKIKLYFYIHIIYLVRVTSVLSGDKILKRVVKWV